jgi:RNA polymerase sigma-B factor
MTSTQTRASGNRTGHSQGGADARQRANAVADHALPGLWRRRQDPVARAALVQRFMPLARSLARRYERSSEPLDDLVQVASLGLVKAIDRYDPSRGNAFVSFAVPTILGELRRYFRDCCWDVHVPRGAQERALKLEEAQYRLTGDLGRSPTVIELAQYLELDVEQVLDAMQASHAYGVVSLDSPRTATGGDDGGTVGDSLGELDERFALVEDGAAIAGALKHLPPRERRVLELRFGGDMTQSEIAAAIGVSQMHVSRLLRHALEQLRILARVSDDGDGDGDGGT